MPGLWQALENSLLLLTPTLAFLCPQQRRLLAAMGFKGGCHQPGCRAGVLAAVPRASCPRLVYIWTWHAFLVHET